MDGVVVFLVATGVLLTLAVLAISYGVDSRDAYADEYARSIGG